MTRRAAPRRTDGWHTAIAIALVLVALGDAAVLSYALRPPPPDDSALVIEAIDTDVAPVASPTPTTTPVELPATVRLLAAFDDRVAWRSTSVGCGAGAVTVERTVDAGATWTATALPDAAGVLALVPGADAQTLRVVLASADCTAVSRTSFSSGSFWRADEVAPAAAVYLDPADAGRVHMPGGRWVRTPCGDVASAAAVDSSHAAVLCVDGTMRLTSDSGATWVGPEGIEQPRALAASDDGYWVASAAADCDGILLVRLESRGEREGADVCTSVDASAAVALSVSGDAVWVWGASVEVVLGAG
ncbi:hypothetical protein [Pseudolysinimonas sp.]|jgi:hypothetical protein|uniref:hypothetical protein n=1 Tax=Pseudolysinimonas sp. TaxID=2680009 RepID=UPI003785292D